MMVSSDTAGARPAISVLVTCYNLGRYLDEAIDSVFAQTFQDFEVIIVDDGSTERETVELLDGYVRPRTRVVRIENRGLPGARNEAARHSHGQYFCALDADDKLEATWFEKATRFLESNPDVAFVSHWLRAFGDEEWDWTPDRCDLESLLVRNTVNGAALVRREVFEEAGGYDESMTLGCEDWDFWLTLVERGFRGAIIPEILFFYRRRLDSMSQEMLRGDTHLQLVERLMRKHEASYREHLEPLLVEKDVELARMRRDLLDRAVEDETWLLPEVERNRQRLARLQAKARRLEDELQERRERQASRETVSRLQRELDAARDEAGRSAEHAAAVDQERQRLEAALERALADAGRLHRDIDHIHASASWRLTRPVRTIGGWFQRPS